MVTFQKKKLALCVALIGACGYSQAASAQGTEEELVVTGFRSSIAKAQDLKRNSVGSVDAIMAEDIADFPDQNLAESLQRIPGVAIDRQAGEGRSITVRGLSPGFSRVTLNGMQTQSISPTGGAITSGRDFDFSVFASELFQQVAVHKTTSAELDEGSLGATVALQTGRPLDMDGDVVALNLQGSYNDLSSELTPRASGLFSMQNEDGTLGALFSIAYSERNVRNEGPQTGRWEDNDYVTFNDDGTVDRNNCSACQNDPNATATTQDDFNMARVNEVNGAYHPRFPRVAEKTHDISRTGVTSTLQWAPSEATTLTLDFMYADAVGQRLEPFSQAISLARTGSSGVQEANIAAYELDANGNMIAATMEDVDVRSEFFVANWESDFAQVSALLEHQFSDSFSMNVLLGTSDSTLSDQQITVAYEHFGDNDSRKRIDYADNDSTLTYDMRDESGLGIEYDWDLNNPANWEKSEFRNRLSTAETGSKTTRVDFEWNLSDAFWLTFGLTDKEYSFSQARSRGDALLDGLYDDDNSACGITPELTSADGEVADIAGLSRFIATSAQVGEYINSGCWPQSNRAGDIRSVTEESFGIFAQANFAVDMGSMVLKGNAGARNVETDVSSTGILSGNTVTVERSYSDTLPAINLALEATEDLIFRASWAQVMSRPNLGDLTPGGSITIFGEPAVSWGNPGLEPFRADTFDVGAEWYFAEGSVLSLAYFQKEIESFPVTEEEDIPFSELGLPESVLGAQADDLRNETFNVRQKVTGEGGDLDGYEIQYQQSLQGLNAPEFIQNMGFIFNYTNVDSSLNFGDLGYRPMYNQSKDTTNFTVYWENDTFSARVSGAQRSGYFDRYSSNTATERLFEGTTFIDASISYQLTDALKLSFEAINLGGESLYRGFGSENTYLYEVHDTGRQFFFGISYRM